MATGGEVHGQLPGSVGSEDLQQLKCQPCLEDGDLQEAVGMCVDCQDYLCLKCYQGHTLPKPMRSHQLLDREQMMQGQIRLNPKDACTEKCSVHDDEVVKYYCKTHCQLGCSACVTLDHTNCTGVQYIPKVAKDLANSEEYSQMESRLSSTLKLFKAVFENNKSKSEEFAANCNKVLNTIKEHRRKVEEVFDSIEKQLVEKIQAIQSAELRELEAIGETYRRAKEHLQASLTKIETLTTARQNCSSYIEMMRANTKLKSLDAQIKEANMHKSCRQRQVKFTVNQDTLDTLTNLESFGTVALSSTGTIVSVKHAQDINVKSSTDTSTCWINGSVVLTDGRLALADRSNTNIKIINVEHGQILSQLSLSSGPWDITNLCQNNVAIALPIERKILIVTVGDTSLSIDRALTVGGSCFGVDYKNDKIAVSFTNPSTVQVLNLQGIVLYHIAADKQGISLFHSPYHLTFGQDDTTLYVSNFDIDNVVCIKLDGNVVSTYTNLHKPRTPVVDSSGNVYVCGQFPPTVHQISKDCKLLRMLLTKDDNLSNPVSICLDKEEDRLYVSSYSKDYVQVYTRVE